ncbi:MAG: mechanosensitive ion channel family protein [Clostridiaceae bacterium]
MDFISWLKTNVLLSTNFYTKIITTIFTILILWLINKIINHLIYKNSNNLQIKYKSKKLSTYFFVFIGFILVLRIWFQAIDSITTFIGIFSAGLAIALKDLIVNVAGFIFIIWRRPFEVGDRIEINKTSGDVIDIRAFQFTLLEIGNWVDADQSTGRIIHVPNGKIFSESVANYSKGFYYIWNEIPVMVTFESDWKKAKSILLTIAKKDGEHLSTEAEANVRKASKKFMIFYSNLTPTVYTNVKDSGIVLTLRYLCKPRNRRNSVEAIWESILDEFEKHDNIDLAYNTLRVYKED